MIWGLGPLILLHAHMGIGTVISSALNLQGPGARGTISGIGKIGQPYCIKKTETEKPKASMIGNDSHFDPDSQCDPLHWKQL